jgi:hypothetical protein
MYRLGFALGLLLLAGSASAQMYAFPDKGQSAEQQSEDKYACYEWAKGETGFDPTQQTTATAPPPSQPMPTGGVARGSLRGATLGAVGGAIAGDAGQGAAIGAATGALMGGMRRREQRQEIAYQQQQAAQKQAAQRQQQQQNYDKAWTACMTGKGYTVN